MHINRKPVKWEKVYIFVSSTFNDMHAERDFLVRQVFPELREWCERRRLHLIDIDLRWGVTEADATRNRRVVQVCLEGIDKCRPFFLCFLGQRYGWIPAEQDISELTFKKFKGLKEAINERRSMTDLEILHGVIRPFSDLSDKNDQSKSETALFFFRDDSYLKDVPEEPGYLRRIYSDESEHNLEIRESLKRKLLSLTTRITNGNLPIHHYKTTWNPEKRTPELEFSLKCPSALEENQKRWREQWFQHTGIEVDSLEIGKGTEQGQSALRFNESISQGRLGGFSCMGKPLKDIILADLKSAIQNQYPHNTEIPQSTPLQLELSQQEQFVSSFTDTYVERTGDFKKLDDFILDDSRKICVLSSFTETGKSILLANWLMKLKTQPKDRVDQLLLYRFVGASDYSMEPHTLILSLLDELSEKVGKDPIEIESQEKMLENWLDLIRSIEPDRQIIILIDGIDKFENSEMGYEWVNCTVPDRMKVIISFSEIMDLKIIKLQGNLNRREDALVSKTKPFEDKGDRKRLLDSYLALYLKELDEEQTTNLISNPGAKNPLFLKVVLNELRTYGGFANLSEKLNQDFGKNCFTAFQGFLKRLENESSCYGLKSIEIVPILFSIMQYSLYGLTVNEMVVITAEDLLLVPDGNKDLKDIVEGFLRESRGFLFRSEFRYKIGALSFRMAIKSFYTKRGTNETKYPARLESEWRKLLCDYFKNRMIELDNENLPDFKRYKIEHAFHEKLGQAAMIKESLAKAEKQYADHSKKRKQIVDHGMSQFGKVKEYTKDLDKIQSKIIKRNRKVDEMMEGFKKTHEQKKKTDSKIDDIFDEFNRITKQSHEIEQKFTLFKPTEEIDSGGRNTDEDATKKIQYEDQEAPLEEFEAPKEMEGSLYFNAFIEDNLNGFNKYQADEYEKINYQVSLLRWKELPWWKRIFKKKPDKPRGYEPN